MFKFFFIKNEETFLLFLFFLNHCCKAAYILIPMDDTQKNHLKAYGIVYWVLQHDVEVKLATKLQGRKLYVNMLMY